MNLHVEPLGESYDVVVVGAGPAGSTTAREASSRGLKVLLVDRSLEIGVPDKCGEFIPSLEEMRRLAPKAENLEALFDPPGWCIINRTRRVNFNFPGGVEVSIPFKGVVVERKLYDKYLAMEAARAGAELMPNAKAVALTPNGVLLRRFGQLQEVSARVVVAADGAYSLIARMGGLPIPRDPYDYAVGYQHEMVDVEQDPANIEMYFGERYAPGTYAWIIPKGRDVANAGVGVRAPYMREGLGIRDYFRRFVEQHPKASEMLRAARATAVKVGCIPVSGPLKETCGERMLAVGDAAGQTIPSVGGGVPTALICGRIAGWAVAQHLLEGVPLRRYEEEWRRQLGETLENSLRMRRMGDLLFSSDRRFNLAVKMGWVDEETVMKVVLCRIDAKMRLMEGTLLRVLGR
ncbi:MAG: geranylgeranyl reductase family protein [Candidatus Bathyarchaeota archaeon B23]|nr:MAG: geranylgeranyl reductase family protein [Candidatus Bathyarchaeota archaeon B23]